MTWRLMTGNVPLADQDGRQYCYGSMVDAAAVAGPRGCSVEDLAPFGMDEEEEEEEEEEDDDLRDAILDFIGISPAEARDLDRDDVITLLRRHSG